VSETRVSVSDRARVASARTHGFLSSLFPRFDEAISPELYRMTGKLRVFANLLFLLGNAALAPQIEALGFDRHVHWRVLAIYTGVHSIDLLLGLWLWRFARAPGLMRRLTYTSLVLEMIAVVGASWVYGSVNSPFIGIELVFISMYRLAFDFRIGVTSLSLIVGGQWAIVAAELARWLPHQPISAGAIDGVYAAPMREVGAMVNLTFAIVLTFAAASWAVGRVRHRELAIRLLRESLYAADKGKVGRHTGRTLRDTYALGSLLGAGGTGEVYRGTHLRTSRAVAVKMLHPHLIEDPAVLVRFRREAEVTGRLGSEHIVGVIDVDEADGLPFLVLELMEGQNVAARIKERGPLPLPEVAELIEQTAKGLDVAHAAGVIHRDMKPENLIVVPRRDGTGFTVKILDFGVSKIAGNATAITREVAMLGTPDFMSPEQAEGHADNAGAASDVFALGAVAYNAITGRRPFEADSVPAVLRRICDEEPTAIRELRPDVPAPVEAVIAIAMAKDSGARYASAHELASDLRLAIDGKLDAVTEERARQLVRGKPASKKRLQASDFRLQTSERPDPGSEVRSPKSEV
jgi:serine/threonine protein kinase